MTTLSLTVNGRSREVEIDGRQLLVEALRGPLGLTGTHAGCLNGDCGACTVQLDGRVVKSCLVLAVQAEGHHVVTIEGFAQDGLDVIQEAFWDEYGFQCGFCLPGQLFAAADLLARNPAPSEVEIREALDGNLCRCTGYELTVRAVQAAAERLQAS